MTVANTPDLDFLKKLCVNCMTVPGSWANPVHAATVKISAVFQLHRNSVPLSYYRN